MLKGLFFITLFFLLNKIKPKISIEKSTKYFIDSDNRVNIFHGVNIIYKIYPFHPDVITKAFDPFTSFNDEDVKIIKKLGFNVVRLGIIWEGLETEPGKYNLEYLEKIKIIINKLGSHGIYTILDAHQDLFSRIFCGEGVPSFYAKDIPVDKTCSSTITAEYFKLIGMCIPLSSHNWEYEKIYTNSFPTKESCAKNYSKYFQSSELASAFYYFYTNEDLQNKFTNFWKKIADFFQDNINILGLDLLNKPWVANLFIDKTSLIPGYTDNNYLKNFYFKIFSEIKKIKKDFLYFLGPTSLPDSLPLFGGQNLGGFISPPLGEDELAYQVLNIQSYCCMAGPNMCLNGEPSLKDSESICPLFHKRRLEKNKKSANSLGIPLLVSEFGSCSNSVSCLNEIKAFTNSAENNLISWIYYMYKPFNDLNSILEKRVNLEGLFHEDGKIQELKEKGLTRTYSQAYQGVPISSSVDYESGFYLTSFDLNISIDKPTRIYFNREIFYPEFSEKFEVLVYNEINEKIINDKNISEENYLDIKINKVNFFEYELENGKNEICKNSFLFSSRNLQKIFFNPIFISIVPKLRINLSNTYNKEIKYEILASNDLKNKIKINCLVGMNIDSRFNIEVEYLKGKNKIFKNLKKNIEIIISDLNVFVKRLVVITTVGNVIVENMFNYVLIINL